MSHSEERSPQQTQRCPESSVRECMIIPEGAGTFRLSLGWQQQGAFCQGSLTLPYTASFTPLSLSHPETGTTVTVTAEEMRAFMASGYDFATESRRFCTLYPEGAPRVAFLVNDPSHMGGGVITLCRYINWLADLGVEVGLYTEGPLPSWTTVNARIHRIRDFRERYAAVTEPVVVIFSIFEVPFLLGCNDTRGKRIYHLCQGAEEFHFTPDSSDLMRPLPVFDLLNTLPVGRLVVSPHLQGYFAQKYGQTPLLIANGIDGDLFRPGPSRRPDQRFTVLVSGDPWHELKGVTVVREALALLSTRRPERRFRLLNVCGALPDRPLPSGAGFDYELVCGLDPRQMQDRYREADVYVNASRYEGFGLPTLEAMACGTPVIQADNHGMDGVVQDGRDCVAVPPGSPAALAQALERLLDDAPLRERLAENGRGTAGRFTLANQHRMLREVFGEATGKGLGEDGARVPGAAGSPLFSVMVPCYNQAHFLTHALKSLIDQSYPNWEAIVVNDGSSDDTARVMESHAASDARIRCFHKENGGVASALNRALAEARGEWICWLSSDDLFLPEKLALHAAEIARDPGLRLMQTDYLVLYEETGATTPSSIDTKSFIPPVEEQVVRFFQINYYNGISVAVHRSVFETVGGFNEDYRYGQDYDLWLRASARFRSRFLDQASCVTRIHPGQGTNLFTQAGIYDSARAALDFLNRHAFAELFPRYDLSQADQALAAVGAVLRVMTSPDSFLGRCGYLPALADRMREWLAREAPAQVREGVRELFRQSSGALRELLERICAPSDTGYRPHDPIAALERQLELVRRGGDRGEEEAMLRYLAMVAELKKKKAMVPDKKAAAPLFDSARDMAEFLNCHGFAELFPLLDLSVHADAVKAVQETLSLALAPDAQMRRDGPASALLERLHEWLDCHAPAQVAASLRPQIAAIAHGAAQSGAASELVSALQDFGRSYPGGYRFLPHDLRAEAEASREEAALPVHDPHYFTQKVPITVIPDRMELLDSLCRGKKVLHVGCTDHPVFDPATNLHIHLGGICRELDGLDVDLAGIEVLRRHVPGRYFSDPEQVSQAYDVLLVPETIEHVDNVRQFLESLTRIPFKQCLITAPNAFLPDDNGNGWSGPGEYVEYVHPDHNCWFSPHTLRRCIKKFTGWEIEETFLLGNQTQVGCLCTPAAD